MKPKKKSNWSKTYPFVLAAMLFGLFSCGDDDDGDTTTIIEAPRQEEQANGSFIVPLITINTNVVNNVSSINKVTVTGDDVDFNLVVRGVPPQIRHKQGIHIGNSCPSLADDTNQDGFVDSDEVLQKSGGILIPLDSNLSSQSAGSSNYPLANASGEYTYSEKASLEQLNNDLDNVDSNLNDEFVKLPAGQPLNLEGRVLIIYGVPESQILPETVSSFPGDSPQESLPLACGPVQLEVGSGVAGGVAAGGVAGGAAAGGAAGGSSTGGVAPDECGDSEDCLPTCAEEAEFFECQEGFIDACLTGEQDFHECVPFDPCPEDSSLSGSGLSVECPGDNGGFDEGGVEAGGVAGGADAGGVDAGGDVTGGVDAGGDVTGGVDAGGDVTGGVDAGGDVTGGDVTGGVDTGGVDTGDSGTLQQ
jgi:hypothetical protein